MTPEELRKEVVRLGPWHIDVEITPEISTGDLIAKSQANPEVDPGITGTYSPRNSFLARLNRMFPGGLEGRTILDCACNCGAYSFFAKEIGAGRCFGFDVREHWIAQARFLAEHREKPTDDMRFEACNLYDLPELGLGSFDLTLFFGIFYHLSDPVTGLKVAADITREALILNTKARPNHADGALVASEESPAASLAGVDSLVWFPTGPIVLARILNWLGFPEVRCSRWLDSRSDDLDRIEVIAARTPGFFEAWDTARPRGISAVREVIETNTNPRATVTILTGDERLVRRLQRNAVRLPVDGALADADRVAELERQCAAGSSYVAVAADALTRLHEWPLVVERLGEIGAVTTEDPLCRIYTLK